MANELGKHLRAWRIHRRLRIEELATIAGISWAVLEDIEAGRRFPPLLELERLLAALRVHLRELHEEPPGNEA